MTNLYGGPGEEERKPNPAVFGTPMQPKPADTSGAAVTPQLGAGSVMPGSATPSMAKGGAIPDDDADDADDALQTITDVINEAMMYGRQKFRLPSGQKRQAPQDDSGIPDDSGDDDSYAEGGSIADDIEASNNAAPDERQYGRPEHADIARNGETPPISGDNLDRNMVDARMGGTQPQVPISGDNLDRNVEPYDNAGAVEAPGDNSGAAPAVGAIPETHDDSGAAPVAQSRPGAVPAGAIPDESTDAMGNAQGGGASAQPQQVLGYLQGKGALSPDEVKHVEAHVPGNAAEKAASAVAKITKEQGPDAGFGAIQYNRAAYNAKAGFAYMALNGTAQKPPDLVAAAKAATQATPHLLDGKLLTFEPSEGGVTASTDGQSFKLTIPQFNQFLDIRKTGQFDAVFESGGALTVLKDVMKGAGEPPASLQTGVGTIGAPAARGASPAGGAPTPAGRITPPPAGEDDEEETPGRKQNTVTIHAGGETRRYINGEDQTDNENQAKKLELVRAKNEWHGTADDRLKLEDRKGDNRLKVEDRRDARAAGSLAERTAFHQQQLKVRLQEVAARTQNASQAVRGRMIDTILASEGGLSRVSPEVRKLANEVLHGAPQPAGGAPQAQQQGAPQRVSSPAEAHKLAPGTVYMTPDGRKFTR